MKRRGGLDISAMLKVMSPLDSADADGVDPKMRQRRLLADLCRLIGDHVRNPTAQDGSGGATSANARDDDDGMSPRLRQTLHCLLTGDSEKQAAAKLGVSPHTLHVYVKQLYRKFGVSSRGELLARWVKRR